MATWYFAWVDPTDTTWSAPFAREDEKVFSFEISHVEGQFASLSVVIENPGAGLLNPSRKQWAWIAADFGDTAGTQELFFGRLVGMPDDITENLVRLIFHARPDNFKTAKVAAADALKVEPYWDPVWITPDLLDDPDAVLESRSELWHIDRVTHSVTASDVLEGEDGIIDLAGDVFRNSVDLAFGSPPRSRINCEATVGWDQAARGSVDITKQLVQAFHDEGTTRAHCISSFTGQGLMAEWPKRGTDIGGNWSFGQTSIRRLDGKSFNTRFQPVILSSFNGGWGGNTASWPLWEMKPDLNVKYKVNRRRTEIVRFTLSADAQSFIVDPEDDEELTVSLSSDLVGEPIDAGDELPIGSRKRRSYFNTDRGKRSLKYLVLVCRARLRAASRSVEIKGETRITNGLAFSCRKEIRIADARLPGGEATGKIKSYTLSMDGSTGEAKAGFVIGCAVGRGVAISVPAGSPSYAETGYMADGYQFMTGAGLEAVLDEVYIDDFSVEPNDDGLNFNNITAADAIDAITVINGETDQRTLIGAYASTLDETGAALDEAYTEILLELNPISNGPFETEFAITVSDLALPKKIDLEAA